MRGALERRLQRRNALFPVACDIFQHDNRIVDDKAGRDCQRHQREDVQRVARQIHHAEGSDQRQRHSDARDDRGGDVAQKQKRHEHHQQHGKDQLVLHGAHGGADALRAVGEHGHVHRGGQTRGKLWQQRLHPIDHLDDVGAGLALHVDQDGRQLVRPRGEPTVLGGIFNAGDVTEPQRSAIAPGDDEIAVFLDGTELVVRVHEDRAHGTIKTSLRPVDAGGADSGAHVREAEAARREFAGIDLHAHGGTLAAGETHHADAGNLREFLRDARIDQVVHLRQRQAAGRHRESENRRIGGIHLPVNRRRRQIVRQEIARGIDGCLHFLLRNAHGDFERKLEGDHRRAAGTHRRQLVDARYLAETSLKRGGDGTRRHGRTRARVERENLNRGKFHLRQRRDGQEPIREHAGKQQRDHQEAGRHRTENERTRGVHFSFFFFFAAPSPFPSPASARGAGTALAASSLTTETKRPSRNRSRPSSTTRSPT